MNKHIQYFHERLPAWAADWLDVFVPLVQVGLIVLAAWLLMRVARRLTQRLTDAYALPPKVSMLSRRIAGVVIYSGAVFWSLERLGVSGAVLWTAFTGFAAVGAVAFFAVWSVLSNLFCALMIFTTRAFRAGDFVEVIENGDKPGLRGRVLDINLVYTTLQESGDEGSGTTLQLPNSLFFQRALRRWHGTVSFDTLPRVPNLVPEDARRGTSASPGAVATPWAPGA
jgi:small-conductance mechanosensitive channel